MKELKNKEVIAGLIVIIILGCIALFLLIKREIVNTPVKSTNYQTEATGQETLSMEKETESLPLIMPDDTVRVDNSEKEELHEDTKKEAAEDQKENKEKKRYHLYTVLGDKQYKVKSMRQRKTEDGQLEELYNYWDSYRLDAVGEVIRLPRIGKVVEELEKDTFYYYGSTDSLGRPSGKGLAVYFDYSFYFGEWKEGLREGKGMWIQPALYEDEFKNANLGLIEHSYNGDWKKDLPNGEGQEHFSYDYEILKEDYLTHGFAIANVLGDFKDGYYHGEMYIMTTDEAGVTKDWSGLCENGSWDIMIKGSITDAIWQSHKKDDQGNYSYHYVFPKENEGYGVHGLMK